jgi:predicted O-methyltransferase YrrM
MIKSRYDLAALVPPHGSMLELGVAAGDGAVGFLARLHPSAIYLGVDAWAGDGAIQLHDDAEYQAARDKIREHGNARAALIRATFDEAYVQLVEEIPQFDFVFVDGYAHEGSGGAEELLRWWGLVRPGGVFGVHDYCAAWPRQVEAVNGFLRAIGRASCDVTSDPEEAFPSAVIIKAC